MNINISPRFQGLAFADPLANPLDALLADIAVRVQLPPGLHQQACDRKAAVQRYLERPASSLPWVIFRFYPQGSMAIDATISTRGTDDEYDLDLVIELLVPPGTPPGQVLDELFKALRDYPVARVTRQTRCVTLHYADGMHLDLTPARRVPNTLDFGSVIFHAKSEDSQLLHREIAMNAYGFGNWYNLKAPPEERFSLAYHSRLAKAYGMSVVADAVDHPVPDQTPLTRKSVTTVGLQLIKRFRNIWSSTRDGRYPPSVMLSCHAGHAASPGMALGEMVIRQARWTARAIDKAEALGQRLDVRNPIMPEDCFTDRWPENRAQQRAFAAALHDLANGLEYIGRTGEQLEDVQDWLRHIFGPAVVSKSIQSFVQRTGHALRATEQSYAPSGRLYVPSAPAVIGVASAVSSVVPARAHTNMGERR